MKEVCGQLDALAKDYKEACQMIKERDAKQLAYDTLRAHFNPKSTSGNEAKQMAKAKEEYQEANRRVLHRLAEVDGRHNKTLYMVSLRAQEARAMTGIESDNALELWGRIVDCCNRAQSLITESEGAQSPKDVPTESIHSECATSTTLKPVRVLRPCDLQSQASEGEEVRVESVSKLKEAFESKHKAQSPNPESGDSSVPELPSGKSRVAALAAQLEASKIIFRPMQPNARPKPKRDTDLEEAEEEDLVRLFNPFSKRFPQKKRLEVAPKPPKKAYVLAMYDFAGQQKGDLGFRRGDRIEVLVRTDSQQDWWTGRHKGTIGVFPANYTRTL